jgi:thiamine-phosphate pyrophosphorylase
MTERCRLYLITPPEIGDLPQFADTLREALAAGDVAALQLRLKSRDGVSSSDEDILKTAEALLPICRAHDVALLVNDRPDLAKMAGADGAHIGQEDMAYKNARALLGDTATIGVTCHNSKDLAIEAGEAGADYVAFGAFFPTMTKDPKARAHPEILEWWSYATTVPCVAIGGITPENCGALVRAGANFLAVSNAVWAHEKGSGAALRAFNEAIARAAESR